MTPCNALRPLHVQAWTLEIISYTLSFLAQGLVFWAQGFGLRAKDYGKGINAPGTMNGPCPVDVGQEVALLGLSS